MSVCERVSFNMRDAAAVAANTTTMPAMNMSRTLRCASCGTRSTCNVVTKSANRVSSVPIVLLLLDEGETHEL